MWTAVELVDRFGLSGAGRTVGAAVGSKLLQRRRWEDDPQLSVRFTSVESVEDLREAVSREASGQVVVKPARSRGGSRGVVIHRAGDDAEASLQTAETSSLDGSVIAEEVLVGEQLTCDALLVDGEATVYGVGRNVKQPPPYRVNLAIEYQAVSIAGWETKPGGPGGRGPVEAFVERCADRLGYTDGPVHLEMVATPVGLRPIELAARCGGGVIPDLLAAMTGRHPMVDAALVACGSRPPARSPKPHGAAVIRYLTPPPGWHPEGGWVHGDLRADRGEEDRLVDAYVFPVDDGSPGELRTTSDRWGQIAVVGSDVDDCWNRVARIGATVSAACVRPEGG